MANDLALIEPIPVPANPARMPSLPAWLARRTDVLENVNQPDMATGKHLTVPTMPASMILTSSERRMVEQHIAVLSRFLDLGQTIELRDRVLSNDQAMGVMVAALLVKKGQRMDAAMSEALTEDYLDALDDLPAWSVREAIRKWNRAESPQLDKKPHDFNWRPEPPTLRRLAWMEVWNVRGRMETLQRMLVAVPRIEYSPEHKAHMLGKLAEVVHGFEPDPLLAAEKRMRKAERIGRYVDQVAARSEASE
jgi:hypothetical protein